MKKIFALLVAISLLALGVAAYKLGWLGKALRSSAPVAQSPATAGAARAGAPGQPESSPGGSTGAVPPAAGSTQPAQAGALPVFDGNVAGLTWGGKVESATGLDPGDDRMLNLIDDDKDSHWRTDAGVTEIVMSFFEREPVLVEAVVITAFEPAPRSVPGGLEVWASMTSPTDGFKQVATGSLSPADEGRLRFAPVEARYLKLRLLRNLDGEEQFDLAEVKIIESHRSGYTAMLTRHPEIVHVPGLDAGAVATAAVPAAAALVCAPAPQAAPPPGHAESRKVLMVGGRDSERLQGEYEAFQSTARAKPPTRPGGADFSILDRAGITFVKSDRVQGWSLAPRYGYDTIVLEQVCGDEAPLPPTFKQALMPWVAAGHKLIIHDADKCGHGADLSFLPFPLKTDNPGAQGAEGHGLQFVEQNSMAHGRPGKPGYVDVQAWVNGIEGYTNELGDSNTVTQWDPHWCGHLVVQNVNNVFGFVEVYAHYGRGLIIYGGFDVDQIKTTGYDVMITRELAQGFDPDNLPCSARLGDFVVTTDARLTERPVVPGRSYVYPLTLLSNQGYKGTIALSMTASPGAEGLTSRFEPASVAVTQTGESTLTITLPPGAGPRPQAFAVKGTDGSGKTNMLCLQLSEPRTGELSIVSGLGEKRLTKNLEIVLDASGSMKTALGKKTRWTTALDVLRGMLAQLPDDFNVGLRLYGHREASRSPKTCTDSELAVPIGKLDRQAVFNAANAVKPKGETPLVYSVLQAPADLKAVGGGTVIVITDGEESCKGDMVKAAAGLKASGQDITLNIVGFTLTGQKAQAPLAAFAQSTGGRFYAADTGEALARALLIAAIEKFPYSVFDAGGKLVAGGEAGSGAEELAPGTYKVVVQAGDESLVAEHVQVVLGKQTTVRIVARNDRLVLQPQ
jgi:hypothetical protein